MKTEHVKLIADALNLNMEDCRAHGYNLAGAIGACIAFADTLTREDANFDKDAFLLSVGCGEYDLLRIDAWNTPDGWTWNNWHKVGKVPQSVADYKPRQLLQWLRNNHYLSGSSAGTLAIEDDGHNIVIMLKGTREPLLAIEYGSKL
jgi:hypothetical protein